MSFRRQKEPSPLWSRGDLIDQLIYQALLSEVEEAKPSPRVWTNIRRCVSAAGVSWQRKSTQEWILSLLNGAVTVLDALLCNDEWEIQLIRYRKADFWLLSISGGMVPAVQSAALGGGFASLAT